MPDPFELAKQEPGLWEQTLTEAGLPTQAAQTIVLNPALAVSERRWGTQAAGFELAGGVNSPSEEFTLGESFQ